MHEIVCRRLVGHDIRAHAARLRTCEDLRQNLRGIAEEPDRGRRLALDRIVQHGQCLVQRMCLVLEIASAQPEVDA